MHLHFGLSFVGLDCLTLFSAGSKDSVLTNHGILQAERLGQHFAQAGIKFTKIFSSDLQRAYKTAEAIRLAQSQVDHDLVVAQLPALREQHFGRYEGKPFHARDGSFQSSATSTENSKDVGKPDFEDVESRESMTQRTEAFVRAELLPLLHGESPDAESVVCVVSHGIILSHLWRVFLHEFPKHSVAFAPDCRRDGFPRPLEHLGGWSNTGYLQLEIRRSLTSAAEANKDVAIAAVTPKPEAMRPTSPTPLLPFRMTIIKVNSKDHLQGLKRARGGLGSSEHDESQKKIDAFFKKPKKV